jgi:hypothetical protein
MPQCRKTVSSTATPISEAAVNTAARHGQARQTVGSTARPRSPTPAVNATTEYQSNPDNNTPIAHP